MSKVRWIDIDPDEIDSKERGAKKGVHLEFSLSPYDIPERVRGFYCEDRKRFVIEFRYMTEEPLVERKLTPHVTVMEGKGSGRLYDILVDVDALNVGRITAAIQEVEEVPGSQPASKREQLNSRLFETVRERVIPNVAEFA